jgi:DNA-binding transcriptional regulator YdaS (Cro superfamily)
MRVDVEWTRALLGLERGSTVPVVRRPLTNAVARARELQRALAVEGSDADVARAYGLTRASVCQYLTLVRRLPSDLLDEVEAVTDRNRLKRLSLRQLLAVAHVEGEGRRRRQFAMLLGAEEVSRRLGR